MSLSLGINETAGLALNGTGTPGITVERTPGFVLDRAPAITGSPVLSVNPVVLKTEFLAPFGNFNTCVSSFIEAALKIPGAHILAVDEENFR